VVELREYSRMHDELTRQLGRLSNQLRDVLKDYFPQLLTLCPAANEPWLWDLLERAPIPAVARELRPGRVSTILKARRIRRFTADEVVAVLRAPAVPAGAGVLRSAQVHLGILLPQLDLISRQLQGVDRRVTALLEALEEPSASEAEHEGDDPPPPTDVAILRSITGVGDRVASCLLGEAWETIAARDETSMRALVGAAPVTRQSGKTRLVSMRRACDGRLRAAMHHWAAVYAQRDPHGKALYAALRARGKGHARACRAIADRLLTMLFAMLRDRTLHDVSKRKRFAEAA
jgi:transposase